MKDISLLYVFLSIGIIFKSQITEVSGFLNLDTATKFGFSVWQQYNSATMQKNRESLAFKDRIELIYYINIINCIISGSICA